MTLIGMGVFTAETRRHGEEPGIYRGSTRMNADQEDKHYH
jgi:hypothetical protein